MNMYEKMISREETERILDYVNANYKSAGYMRGRDKDKHTIATKTLRTNEQFETYIHINVFHGESFNSVSVHLWTKTKEKVGWKKGGCNIEKLVFSLEELQELEGKAEELESFTINLGIWK